MTSLGVVSRNIVSSTRGGSPTGSTRTPDVGVRRATVDDAEAFERIRIGTWQATYRGLFPDALLNGMRPNVDRRRDRLREILESQTEFCFVAEDGGEVVGF